MVTVLHRGRTCRPVLVARTFQAVAPLRGGPYGLWSVAESLRTVEPCGDIPAKRAPAQRRPRETGSRGRSAHHAFGRPGPAVVARAIGVAPRPSR
jgi:hypothetical protein